MKLPLARCELPKKSAIVSRQLWHVIYKPLHAVAKGRRLGGEEEAPADAEEQPEDPNVARAEAEPAGVTS